MLVGQLFILSFLTLELVSESLIRIQFSTNDSGFPKIFLNFIIGSNLSVWQKSFHRSHFQRNISPRLKNTWSILRTRQEEKTNNLIIYPDFDLSCLRSIEVLFKISFVHCVHHFRILRNLIAHVWVFIHRAACIGTQIVRGECRRIIIIISHLFSPWGLLVPANICIIPISNIYVLIQCDMEFVCHI